jgi:hypothetical protein
MVSETVAYIVRRHVCFWAFIAVLRDRCGATALAGDRHYERWNTGGVRTVCNVGRSTRLYPPVKASPRGGTDQARPRGSYIYFAAAKGICFAIEGPMTYNGSDRFVTLRRFLANERAQLVKRLRQIDNAFDEIDIVSSLHSRETEPTLRQDATCSQGGADAAKPRRRVLSPEARARIVAAQKARWAKARGY